MKREATAELKQLLQDPAAVEGRYLISYQVVDTEGAKSEDDFKPVTGGYIDASVATVHWQMYKESNRIQKLMAQHECDHPAPIVDTKGRKTCLDCEKIWQ